MEQRRQAQERVFLSEIDDALREDDAVRLYRRYGRPVGAALLAVIVGLGGWMLWTNHVNAAAGARGEAMTIALDQIDAGRYDTALDSLKTVATTSTGGLAASARLAAAGVAYDRKDTAGAASQFAAIAADAAVPQPYRDLATVREVAIRFDTMAPAQVIDRLKPLAIPGNPWFGSAGEMTAIAQLKLNRKRDAGITLAAIAHDTTAPGSIRGRARQLAIEFGVDPGPELAAPGAGAAQ